MVDNNTPKPDGGVWSVDPNDDRNKPDENGRYPRSFQFTYTRTVSKEEYEANKMWLRLMHLEDQQSQREEGTHDSTK